MYIDSQEAGRLRRPNAQVPTQWDSASPVRWRHTGELKPPLCPLKLDLEWASHSPRLPLHYVLSFRSPSILRLDRLFPLHMSEQTERGISDRCWPGEHGVYAASPTDESCTHLPPPSPLKLTFLHPAEMTGNPGVPLSFPQE